MKSFKEYFEDKTNNEFGDDWGHWEESMHTVHKRFFDISAEYITELKYIIINEEKT